MLSMIRLLYEPWRLHYLIFQWNSFQYKSSISAHRSMNHCVKLEQWRVALVLFISHLHDHIVNSWITIWIHHWMHKLPYGCKMSLSKQNIELFLLGLKVGYIICSEAKHEMLQIWEAFKIWISFTVQLTLFMVGRAHYLGADEKYDCIQPEIADNEIVRNGKMQICICAQFEAVLTEIYLHWKTKFALNF